LQSDGGGEDAIKILDGAARNTVRDDTFDIMEIEPGIKRSRRHLILKGIDIFNFALKEVTPNINELFRFANIEKEKVDYFVFHQANKLINESVRKKLKVLTLLKCLILLIFWKYKFSFYSFNDGYSNKEQLQKPNTLLFSGFGVGFSWASCFLKRIKFIVQI
jgi:3-oxoacyl-[acyl-carrier-protein] synthase-3